MMNNVTSVSLDPREACVVLTLARTIQKLSSENGQKFLACAWVDLRTNKNSDFDQAIAAFFDLYFASRGDFKRIERVILSAVHKDVKKEVLSVVEEAVAENLEKFGTDIGEIGIISYSSCEASET